MSSTAEAPMNLQEVKSLLHEATHKIAEQVAQKEPPSPLITLKERTRKKELELNKLLDELLERYRTASEVLFKHMELLSHTDKSIDFEKIKRDLPSTMSALSKKNVQEIIKRGSAEELSHPAKLFKISNELLNALYKTACAIFEQKDFESASAIFSMLCLLEPSKYDYWIGLGHSAFYNQKYDDAVLAYYQAILFPDTTYWPLIWAANACEGKKDFGAVVQLLEATKEILSESPEKEEKTLLAEVNNRLAFAKQSVRK